MLLWKNISFSEINGEYCGYSYTFSQFTEDRSYRYLYYVCDYFISYIRIWVRDSSSHRINRGRVITEKDPTATTITAKTSLFLTLNLSGATLDSCFLFFFFAFAPTIRSRSRPEPCNYWYMQTNERYAIYWVKYIGSTSKYMASVSKKGMQLLGERERESKI